MISILIADDHGLFRRGIIKILNESLHCRVIGEAENGQELIAKYFELKPDVILVDISMPVISGIDAFIKIMESDKSVKALFLTMHDDEEYIIKIYKSGGRGLINKNYLEEDLYKIVQKVYQGDCYFGEKWDKAKLQKLSVFSPIVVHKNQKDLNRLSSREMEIFILIGKGYSSSQISEKLYISKRTVDTHKTHIYQKLEIRSFHDLFKLAFKYNFDKKQENE
ncbi:MAG TPA: response regulator transcription factor [Ignavibacteriales bacterium]|nr:response regulator transcription factor [Ignavibacteriales bacterium]